MINLYTNCRMTSRINTLPFGPMAPTRDSVWIIRNLQGGMIYISKRDKKEIRKNLKWLTKIYS